MQGDGRTVNLAIAGVLLASALIFTGTAGARSGSAGYGHTRYAGSSGMSRNASTMVSRAPWYRDSGRTMPDGRTSRQPAADQHRGTYSPAPATEASRQGVLHANSPRGGDTPGADSPQGGQDYRQHRAEYRHAPIPAQQVNAGSTPVESPQTGRDYRQSSAQNRYASNSNVAVAAAPVSVQPVVYATSAPVAGYGSMGAGNNLYPLAGLLTEAVSAVIEYFRTDEQYDSNQAYDWGD
jgi:hypothetical protein